MIESLEIPQELIGLFDAKHYHYGKLQLEVHDHRFHGLKPTLVQVSHTSLSLVQEYVEKAKASGKEVTDKLLCEIEARYLIESVPNLDLTPTIDSLYHRNAQQFNLKKFNFKRQKSQICEPTKQDYLFTMDEKHGRKFEPSYARLDIINNYRKRKLAESLTPSAFVTDQRIQMPDRRILVRTIRFVRGKVYSILNIFSIPDKHDEFEAELKWGDIRDTYSNGEIFRYHLGPKFTAAACILSFSRFYAIQNEQCYDSFEKSFTPKREDEKKKRKMSPSDKGFHYLQNRWYGAQAMFKEQQRNFVPPSPMHKLPMYQVPRFDQQYMLEKHKDDKRRRICKTDGYVMPFPPFMTHYQQLLKQNPRPPN